ncbi:DUF6541 family protein [Actinotalea solisilvae]|uniref:DUF6541 family protein n=1 Tax=Actinotalea solisilvae TaxID=2072922 RepID=UPI0018F1F53D|nr:DUF6541 family protein [Actinotalea solisilvae]
MEWVAAGGAGLLALATFWLPGLAVLRAAGHRGLLLVAAAPVATLATAGLGAVVAHAVGVPWGRPTAAAATVVAALGAYALRSRDATSRAPASGRYGRATALAVAVGTLLQVVPVAVAMRAPGRLLDAYDVVVHLTTVRHVQETGIGSSLVLSDAGEPGRAPFFYPAAWHDVTALVPVWPDVPTVSNAAVVLPTALAWSAGAALLTRTLLPARPRAAVWAALLSAAGVALPLTLTGQQAGLIPNAMGLSVLPAVVALVARRGPLGVRWLAGSALVLAGLALVHPNAVLAAGLVLLPWAAHRVVAAVAATRGRARHAALATVAVGLVLLVPVVRLVAQSGPMTHVRAFPGDNPYEWTTTAVAVLSGKLGTAAGGGGVFVVAAAVVGALLVRRLPQARWLAASAGLVLVVFVAGRSGLPVLGDLDVPWYGETKRLAPVVAAMLVPLAALTLDSLGSWLVATGRLRTDLPRRQVAILLGGLLAVPGLVTGALDTAAAARADFGAGGRDGVELPTFASDAELAMLARLGDELGAGAVLGSPHSGAAHLYALHGASVSVRSPLSQVAPGLRDLERRLDDLGTDAQVCADLARFGVRYLYVDPVLFRQERAELPRMTTAPRDGVRVVDRGGTATVYEITACD